MPDETTNVTPETTNEPVQEETVETTQETPVEGETQETPEIDVEQLQATNKKLYERAKKAEAELKALRPSKPAEAKPASPQPNVEEVVLLANGMPEELVNELKAVAQVRKTTLLKAQNDPIFVAVKEKFEKDKKQREASLPAGRGSNSVKPKKDLTTPGLSREEHMKLVKEIS